MSAPIPCVPCCATPTTTNVPGIQGNAGNNGADGISSYAVLGGAGLAAIPADGADTPSLTFSGPGTAPTSWMVVGQYVILGQGPGAALTNPGPYTFEIKSIDSVTQATLTRRAASNDGASLSVDVGAYLSPEGIPGINAISAATQTAFNGFLHGNTINVYSVADPLPIANGGTNSNSADEAARTLGFRYRLLAKLAAANFNTTADQAIANLPATWIIRRIVVQNASINLTTAAGGFYTGAGKTGTVIVAAAQTYTPLTASTIWMDLTLAAGVLTGTAALVATTIYFALTTAQGAAATADIYIWGDDIS